MCCTPLKPSARISHITLHISGKPIKKRGYVPLMIFSVLFFAFIVLMMCRCKYRSKGKNKIKSIAPTIPDDPNRTMVLKNVGDMPDVDQQRYSPVVASPQIRERDVERADSETGSNCNGANSQV